MIRKKQVGTQRMEVKDVVCVISQFKRNPVYLCLCSTQYSIRMLNPNASNCQRAPAPRCSRSDRALSFQVTRNSDTARRLLRAFRVVSVLSPAGAGHRERRTSRRVEELHGKLGRAVDDVAVCGDGDSAAVLGCGGVAVNDHGVDGGGVAGDVDVIDGVGLLRGGCYCESEGVFGQCSD
jgi:hypothetical protein